MDMANTLLNQRGILPLRSNKMAYLPESGLKRASKVIDFPVTFTDALDEYLNANKDFRTRTIEDYRSHARYFLNWSATEGYDQIFMSNLAEDLLMDYRDFLIEEYSPSTVNIRLSTLKAFLAWAYNESYLSVDLHSKLKKIEVDEDDFRFFTEQQVKNLLKIPGQSDYLSLRNFCIMLVMLDNGVRVKELLSLEWKDVQFSQLEIRISGRKTKNRDFRKVPISPYTADKLKLLSKMTQHYFAQTKYLFVSVKGSQLDSSTVRHFLREYGSLADIEGPCSPHMFRHTFAREYVLSGANIFDLQEILGHSTLEMSRRYVRFFSEDIAKKHRKFSPVTRLIG